MRLPCSSLIAVAAGVLTTFAVGCSAESVADDGQAAASDTQDVTSDAATLNLAPDFTTRVTGEAIAGKGVRVEYALERLPQCRGNLGGGGPGWNITGFYSENGGSPKTFEVSALTPDGKDRVAKAARIVPTQGGDLSIWFQVVSRFGCSEFDSQFGQNFHLPVKGAIPEAGASIVFHANGSPTQTGELKAGGKVKITYEQDRLPACRRTERGSPVWTITGFSQIDREATRTFDTARPEGSDREELDALVELPHAGELSLWFQVSSLGGCMQYDSEAGANYRFRIVD
jgi:hypothetical protein